MGPSVVGVSIVGLAKRFSMGPSSFSMDQLCFHHDSKMAIAHTVPPYYINFQCSYLCHSEASNRNMPLWSPSRSWFVITMLFAILGVLLSSSSSMLEASSVMFWPFPFSSIAHLLRFIPPPQVFGNLIQELTSIVERWYPGSSPLEEDSARAWTLIASRSIYRCTGDFVSGTLACAVLVSFLISRHETPIYVFLIWAILVVAYLMNNREELAGNDTDSKGV